MREFWKSAITFAIIFVVFAGNADACTNYMVTKGASVDGSTMITYNADAGGFMEPLRFHPATDWPEGSMLDVYEWDSGKFLGKIKQAAHTYNVIG
nr:C69 family dipeptidase [Candidatus Kapabacteria bacterium]